MFGVTGATVHFGPVTALDDVSVDVPAGQIVTVVGGDGAGKSTLLRALVGQVALDAGSVQAPGAERLGYLPATAGSWLDLSVAENMEFVGEMFGLHGQQLAARTAELLGSADLETARDRLSRQLSGGMRRKLGFSLAMMHSPDLLVLDEPSTGVDPVSRLELWRLITDAAARGAAILTSTTYLDEAERASHIVVLDGGRVLVAGEPSTVVASFDAVITVSPEPVRPEFAWRRGRVFHELWPEAPPPGHTVVEPDLEDVVIALSLRSLSLRGPA